MNLPGLHPAWKSVSLIFMDEGDRKVRDAAETLDFERLYASDIAVASRSFASMINAGLDPDKAAQLVRLIED